MVHPNGDTHVIRESHDKKWTLHHKTIHFGVNPMKYPIRKKNVYPLVISQFRHGTWPIEIDGLPFLIAWWIFPWRTVNVITRWYMIIMTNNG